MPARGASPQAQGCPGDGRDEDAAPRRHRRPTHRQGVVTVQITAEPTRGAPGSTAYLKNVLFTSREARIDDTSQSMEHEGGFSFSEGPGTTPNVGINTRSKSPSIAAFSRISQESDASTHNKWRMPGRTRQGPSCVRSESPQQGEGPLDLSVSGLAAVVDPEMCHSLLGALSVSRSLRDSRLSSPHVPVVFSYYTHKLSQL